MKTKIEDKISVLDSKLSGELNLIGVLLQKTAAYKGQWGISIFLLTLSQEGPPHWLVSGVMDEMNTFWRCGFPESHQTRRCGQINKYS